ncbi:Glycosyltransferase 2-like [Trinorchestia longiramus]|nr:Glycosyltransferase 2-like [Trinorchestia longiramus]
MQPCDVDVSIILPVHNAGRWLEECLESIHGQECGSISLEVSVFLDSSTDESAAVVACWRERLDNRGFQVTVSEEHNSSPKGVGYAKNRAVLQSCGRFLCFMDADDIMLPERVAVQYRVALQQPGALVGCGFTRAPTDSTARYTHWANSLSPAQLITQAYTSHGPTVIMPTWFLERKKFLQVGEFSEAGKGTPEDLLFFYAHLRDGGSVVRVPGSPLLVYRYHEHAATFSVSQETIWKARVEELQKRVLVEWSSFTIWSAGKQGRRLYRSLDLNNRRKVRCFCDVDAKKIGKFYTHEESEERPKPRVPILHFRSAVPPFIICVKLGLTGGQFEQNLASLELTEGKDYYHFN